MIYPEDKRIDGVCVITYKHPKDIKDCETTEDGLLIINRYYGERCKGSYTIYYAMKYGKYFHFKIRNCKHIYKPKNIIKRVVNFIQRRGVFKLK